MSRKIKISAISDLHGNLPAPEFFNPGDVLCICGDVVPLDIQGNTLKCISWFCLKFIPWTDTLPFKKVIMVFGNHDFFAENIGPKSYRNANEVMSILMPGSIKGEHKLQILMDSSWDYMGFKFYGTSWCPDLSSWAFYGDHDELVERYSKIPNCDILLSHCPPRFNNAGVVLQNGTFNYLTNYGCQELAEEISCKNIKLTLCGHVHSGDHKLTDIGGGRNVVNVSMLDENYKKNYLPFEIELMK